MSIEKPKNNSKENSEGEKKFFHGIEIPNVLVSYRRNEMFDSTMPDFINKLAEMGYNVKTLLFDKENLPEEISETILQEEMLLKSSPLKFFDSTIENEYKKIKQQKGEEFARLDIYDDLKFGDRFSLNNLDEIYREATVKEALSFMGMTEIDDISRKIDKEKDPNNAIEFQGKILSGLFKKIKEKPEFAYVCKNNIDSHIKFESPEKGLETVLSWLRDGGINSVEFDRNIQTTERDWVVADRHYNDISKMNLKAKIFELPVPDFVQKLFEENLLDINPKTKIISEINDRFNMMSLFAKWSSLHFYLTPEHFQKVREEIKKDEEKS